MMKILCLLLILANLCVLLWEFRSGAFNQHNESYQQKLTTGKESIVLWDELNTQPIEQPSNTKPHTTE